MTDPTIHDLSNPNFEQNSEINRDIIASIHRGLTKFNSSAYPDPTASPLVLAMQDDNGNVLAGLPEGAAPGSLQEAADSPMRLVLTDAEALSPAWEEYATLRQECLAAAALPNPCPRLYSDAEQRVLLLEVCEGGSALPIGIHIVRQHGSRKSFGWFDNQFNSWACNEGCNAVDSCYFELVRPVVWSDTLEIVYHYDINLLRSVSLASRPGWDDRCRVQGKDQYAIIDEARSYKACAGRR